MSKTFHGVVFTKLLIAILCIQANAQEFKWPRDRAIELAGGVSGTGLYAHVAYVRFYQPKKITEIPYKKRFKSLIGRNKYEPFPCKRTPTLKIPPGLCTKISTFMEVGNGRGYQYRIIGMDAALMYVIFDRTNFFICAKGGVSFSNNRLLTPFDDGNNKPNSYDRYKFGALGGFELERMIGLRQSTSFVAGWEQYYLAQSDSWGNKRWYAFVGLRFKI